MLLVTLIYAASQLIVGSNEVTGGLQGWVVCRNRVDEGGESGLDALENAVQSGVHASGARAIATECRLAERDGWMDGSLAVGGDSTSCGRARAMELSFCDRPHDNNDTAKAHGLGDVKHERVPCPQRAEVLVHRATGTCSRRAPTARLWMASPRGLSPLEDSAGANASLRRAKSGRDHSPAIFVAPADCDLGPAEFLLHRPSSQS